MNTLFAFRSSRRAVVAALGAPHQTNVDSGGLGPLDVWMLRFPCGLSNGAPIDDIAWVEVASEDRDEAHLRVHIPVDAVVPAHWEPNKLAPPLPKWRVMRQDDNGNNEGVGRYTSRCEAEAVALAFEARAHKQTYRFEEL